MRSIWEVQDYRDLLRDAYEEGKIASSAWSYRAMAEHLGMEAGYLHRVIHHQAHLPIRFLPRVLEHLELTGRAAEYFQILVSLARARGQKEKVELRDRADALRDVARRELESAELEIFQNWWVATVRALVEVLGPEAVPEKIAARIHPPVGVDQVRNAVDALLGAGLLARGPAGVPRLRDAHLTAGGAEKAAVVRRLQAQILGLAVEALEAFPPGERDISSLTLALDQDAFEEVREMLRDVRRRIQQRVGRSRKPDRVMQLSLAFFPSAPADRHP
ncbi:MAG: TIGR02147 family protein [Fibrobacteria bacterium]|nr:TIGR02147 family protein [Fibrobacteria bacterium]